MENTIITGHLEIDHNSGTIYFNNQMGQVIVRIAKLPPIPDLKTLYSGMLDVNFEVKGTSWAPKN